MSQQPSSEVSLDEPTCPIYIPEGMHLKEVDGTLGSRCVHEPHVYFTGYCKGGSNTAPLSCEDQGTEREQMSTQPTRVESEDISFLCCHTGDTTAVTNREQLYSDEAVNAASRSLDRRIAQSGESP